MRNPNICQVMQRGEGEGALKEPWTVRAKDRQWWGEGSPMSNATKRPTKRIKSVHGTGTNKLIVELEQSQRRGRAHCMGLKNKWGLKK